MVIQIENLVKRYGDFLALDHLDLHVNEGDIYGLLGPNGAGKTTTIYCLVALLNYDRGRIRIFGEDMQPNSKSIKSNIGLVLEDNAVYDELTVYENIAYFCSLYVKDRQRVDQLTKDVMKEFKLLPYMNVYPKKLAEGVLRCVNIACGVVHKPKLLILDEPMTSIDPGLRSELIQNLKKMNENGTTILYATHYLEEAENICTKMTILNRGKVVANGTNKEVKNMISLGEKISIEVYSLEEEKLDYIRRLPNVYSAFYKNNILEVRSSKGHNNLVHIVTYLSENKVPMGRIYTELPTLNDVFLEITGAGSVEDGGAYVSKSS